MSDPLQIGVSVAAGLGFFSALLYGMLHKRKHPLTDALAKRFGLAVEGDTARGTWTGHLIEIRIQDLGNQRMDILLRLGGADPRLRITREPTRFFRRSPTPPGPFIPPSMSTGYGEPKDVVTGDEEFDQRIQVNGPVGCIVGMLDGETRRLIMAMDSLGTHVAEGWVLLNDRGPLPGSYGNIGGWIERMAELAEALSKRGKARPIDNLADNFHAEQDPEVRRINLACLGAYFPDAPETLDASRAALTDPGSDWIRLQGAVNLRREGWPALRAMIASEERLDGARAAALRALGLTLPPEEAEPLLLAHLASAVPALALSAAETLGDMGNSAAIVVRLDEWAAGQTDKPTARVAREAAEKVRRRLTGAEPGRLSLEEQNEDGRLSRPNGDLPAKP